MSIFFYEGDIVAGKRQGAGTLRMPDGLVYVGQWLDNQINGSGQLTQPNGDVYEGNFVRGKRQGEGTIRYASGEERSGIWEDGSLSEESSSN